MSRYCFGLDGTLLTDEGGQYENAKPIPEAVAKVKTLYDEGHIVII